MRLGMLAEPKLPPRASIFRCDRGRPRRHRVRPRRKGGTGNRGPLALDWRNFLVPEGLRLRPCSSTEHADQRLAVQPPPPKL